MSFPKYPKYKASGVEWLGDVPEGWELARFKQILKEREERSLKGEETLLSVSAYTGVSPRSERVEEGDYLSRAESLEGYKVCLKNDLVVNIMLAWNRALAFTPFDGIVSPAYCVYYLTNKSNPTFLNYLFRSNEYTAYYKAFSTGIIDSRLRIYPDTFGRLYCGLPPLAEQAIIAAFLDRETAKIDGLVAEQKRLMELLKEKRQAVISHAVTKGLNPNAKMKPSGVEWLGDVPEHWGLPKLKSIAMFSGGGTPSRDNPAYWNGDIPWVSPKDMKAERIDGAEESITEIGLRSSASNLLPPGRVLIVVRSGILKHTIPIAINETAVALNQDMKAISFDAAKCIGRFFLRWVQGHNEQLLFAWAKQGATVESIEHSYLAQSVVPLPDICEQVAIVAFLDTETARFDTLTTEAQRAIDLLQERRTALISAAVTGQIDVRNINTKETA